jgi:hypothetical protein
LGFISKYSESNENDFSRVKIYLAYSSKIGSWKTKSTADFNWLYINSKPFERILGLQLTGSYNFYRRSALVLGFELNNIEASDAYNHLSGSRYIFKAKIRSNLSSIYGDLGFEFENNDRKDENYPNRNRIVLNIKHKISNKWSGKITTGYRVSDYQGISRKDNRSRFRLKVSRQVHEKWSLFGKHTYTKNDSSSVTSSYTNNITSFGIEGTF